MKRFVHSLAVALLLPLLAGCIESTTLLKVGKDGSGTVTIREYYSPQLTQMMEGMAGMAQGMAQQMQGAAGQPAKPAEKPDLFKDTVEKKAQQLGPDVKLVKREDLTNAEGWKGYVATFAFDDVSKIKLAVGNDEAGGPAGEGEEEPESDKTAYRFKFTPGSPAKLELVPTKKPTPPAETTAADTAPPDAGQVEGPEMGAQMAAMMGPMLKGMRMTFLVQVDGKIEQTNARYVMNNGNTVVVMDLPMDQVVGNADAMKLMSAKDPKMQEKLLKMNLPGIKLEEPDKAISITFE